MILRLTDGQLSKCVAYGVPRHVEYLENAVRTSAKWREVNIPFAGARTLIEQFELNIFTRARGKRRSGTLPSTMRTLAAVARAVNEWESHPAFSGGAMHGVKADILAAWAHNGLLSPAPVADGSFVVLVPHVERLRINGLWWRTVWRPGHITHCDTEIVNEDEHLGWSPVGS